MIFFNLSSFKKFLKKEKLHMVINQTAFTTRKKFMFDAASVCKLFASLKVEFI